MENNENISQKPKRKKREILIILLVIVIAVLVVGAKFHYNNKFAKEGAMLAELQTVRTAVRLYLTVNKRLPASLKDLVIENYNIEGNSGQYLTGVMVNKDNIPEDSFGNEFIYNKGTGRVNSGTTGYENW